jgi:hypothetical protein
VPHLGNIGISIIRFFLQTFHLTAVELVRRRQNLSLIRQPTKAGIKIDIKRRVLRFQRRDICLDDCTPHTLTVDFTHTPSFTSTLIRQRRTSSARGGQAPTLFSDSSQAINNGGVLLFSFQIITYSPYPTAQRSLTLLCIGILYRLSLCPLKTSELKIKN